MKTLPFFKFDAESWLTGKIQVLPVDEIGIFINLTARIWKAGGELRNDRFLPRLLGATPEQFDAAMQDFLELEIITQSDDGVLRIKFIDDQLAARREFISRCSSGGKKAQETRKAASSDLQETSSNPGATPNATPSNKKEDIREKKEERRVESGNTTTTEAERILGKEIAADFRRWLDVWRETHGNGREMPVYRQDAQIRMLYRLPEAIRKEAIESAIRGGWRAIHDIREPRQGERSSAATARQTGTLTEAPNFSRNERGKK